MGELDGFMRRIKKADEFCLTPIPIDLVSNATCLSHK